MILIITYPQTIFHRQKTWYTEKDDALNSLSQNLTVLTAPSGREPLARPQAFRFSREVPTCRKRAGTLRWARGREGCSDSPPPYLWTPPTPQRAKGYSPLTILKQKSKHKKASAAPVGAIALTLFSLLHLKPLSRCATAPPRGSGHARKLCGLTKNFPAAPLQMLLFSRKKITDRPQTFRYAEMYNDF